MAELFLVQKYLKLSDADLKLNDKLKQEEIEELNLAGGEGESKEVALALVKNNGKITILDEYFEVKRARISTNIAGKYDEGLEIIQLK